MGRSCSLPQQPHVTSAPISVCPIIQHFAYLIVDVPEPWVHPVLPCYVKSTHNHSNTNLIRRIMMRRSQLTLGFFFFFKSCPTSPIYDQQQMYFVGRVAQSVLRLTTGWTIRGSNPGGARFSARPDQPCGPPSLLYNVYLVFPGGKVRPGRAADHSPPSRAAVMEE